MWFFNVVGDFYQLPPVVVQRSGQNINGEANQPPDLSAPVSFCFRSPAWEKLFPFSIVLDHVYRQSDIEFIHVLNKVRVGIVDTQVDSFLQSKVVSYPVKKSILDCSSLTISTPIMLSPYKRAVEQYNMHAMKRLSQEGEMTVAAVVFYTYDKKKTENHIDGSLDDESSLGGQQRKRPNRADTILSEKEQRKKENIEWNANMMARELVATTQVHMIIFQARQRRQ